MPRSLKLLLVGVVAGGAIALVAATLVFGAYDAIALPPPPQGQDAPFSEILIGIAFWTALTLVSSALPVQMPRGTRQAVSFAPILASTFLGGPAVGGWVAAIGTTELRELPGRVPWYGTLANHAAAVIPALGAGIVYEAVLIPGRSPESFLFFVAAMVAGVVYYGLNELITSAFVAARTGRSVFVVVVDGWRSSALNNLALVPLAWLMALVYALTWWATLLFAVPLYITRIGYQRFIEMRLMFTQTIGALAEAVDKRDPFTAQHSQNVKSIGVEIGRAMRTR